MTSTFQRADLLRVRELAVALTAAERGESAPRAPRQQSSAVVGLVGPPGVGKSSVISALAARSRARGESVVVLAVDPTSPLTGGALLGDRIRMGAHGEDPLMFVRSFANRGHPGGLAAAIPAAVDAALALGWDRVFVEPVGGGQNDTEIASCADVVLLVLSPEAGDDVQALKAGVLEMADIIVVNKADRPGASSLLSVLAAASLGAERPPCMLLSITSGLGIEELDEQLRSKRSMPVERRDAAHLTSIVNEVAALARTSLRDPAARADVLALVRSGQRPDAVLRIVRELARVC
jgi:LAO/AO transport system kinase